MTVEGEKDDISGIGQTEAAHRLCSSLSADKKVHYMQKGVGHYGVFNGSRFRSEIVPRISDFMLNAAQGRQAARGRRKVEGVAVHSRSDRRSARHRRGPQYFQSVTQTRIAEARGVLDARLRGHDTHPRYTRAHELR